MTGSQPGGAFGGLAAATGPNLGHPHLTAALPGQLHFHNHHYHAQQQQQQGPSQAPAQVHYATLDGWPSHQHHHHHSVPHSFSTTVSPPSVDIIHHPSSSASSRRTIPSARRSHYPTWVRWQNTGQNHHHVHHTIHRHSGHNAPVPAAHHQRYQHHHHQTFQRYQALAAAAAGGTSLYVSNPTSVSSGFLLNFLTLLPLSPYGQAELGSPDSPEENYEALLQVAERLGEVKPRGLGRIEIDQLCSYKFNADTHTGELF